MAYNPVNPNGQNTMANSAPVVIASNQSAVAVTANAGTNLNTSLLALDSTLTGGTQKAVARGGAKGSTTAADVTSTNVDANTQALDVSVKGSVAAVGDIAHDGINSGNPIQLGAQASTSIAGLTNVANNDRTRLYADISGRLLVSPYCGPEDLVNGVATLTLTSDAAILAAGGANIRYYITSLSASNSSGTATLVNFKNGATTFASFFLAGSGGGATMTFPAPVRMTANTAVNANLSTGVTNVFVSVQGFKINN